jgi:hypothetical protein
MIKDILILLLSLISTSCGSSSIKQNKCKYEVSLFRTPQVYEFLHLMINNDFDYVDSIGVESPTPVAFYIAKYCTDKDSLNFYLKINDRDTTFKYSTIESDSLLLGMSYDNRFIIFNKKDYIWKED